MRIAYADPPYLGCGALYKDKHPNWEHYDKPKAHRDLICGLYDNYPDGWALSTHSPGLQTLLPFCDNTVRVAAWVKPFAAYKPNVNPGYCWEPVIFRGGRRGERYEETRRDWCAANITLRRGLTGAKPRGFCLWLFALMGLKRGDEFVDLFPGSGDVQAAWQEWIGDDTPSLNFALTGDEQSLMKELTILKKRDRENINPTPEAVMAMELWCENYARQNGGSMDFWEDISDTGKRRCEDAVKRILEAAKAHGR